MSAKRLSETQALYTAAGISLGTLAAIFGLALGVQHLQEIAHTTVSAVIPVTNLTAEASQGRHLFLMNCAHCHGDDARGDECPNLYDLRRSDQSIHDLVARGKKGEMPSFGQKLNDSDIRALTAYLRTLRS